MHKIITIVLVLIGSSIILYSLYFIIIQQIKAYKNPNKEINYPDLENNCKLINERETNLKEKLYFQNITGGFFVTLFIISFIVFIILLDFYSAKYSLTFLFIATAFLYLNLFNDLKKVGKVSKKVRKLEGKVKFTWLAQTIANRPARMVKYLLIEKEAYYIPPTLTMPKSKTDMVVEIYDNKEIISINDQKPLDNIEIDTLRNNKLYHKVIAITFLIITILSFVLLYHSMYTNVSMRMLLLDKKEMEYINANSIRNNPPKIGQRIDISGYRLCKVPYCQQFLLLDKNFEYKFDNDIKKLFDFNKENIFFRRLFYSKFNKYSHPFKHKTKLLNIQEYLQILEKLRNYKFDAITYETNGYIIRNQNQINEYYTFFTNLCEKQKTQCTQDNSLDIYYSSNNYNYIAKNRKIILENILLNERQKIINKINKYLDESNNQVNIKYLENYSFEKNTDLNVKNYDDFIAQFQNNITKVYSIKFIVYDYQEKAINGNKNYYITVIDNLDDEEILDFQLIFLYLSILVILTLTHLFLFYINKKPLKKVHLK